MVVPIAGKDDAFQDRGYPFCKPLTEVRGRPLIEHVWECLRQLKAERYAFVIRKEDARRFHLHEVLRLLDPAAAVIPGDGPRRGPPAPPCWRSSTSGPRASS